MHSLGTMETLNQSLWLWHVWGPGAQILGLNSPHLSPLIAELVDDSLLIGGSSTNFLSN